MPSSEDSHFSLFTTIRYDVSLKRASADGLNHAARNYQQESPLYMLDYHRDRMLKAALHWQWEDAILALSGHEALASLASLAEESIGSQPNAPRRIKIMIDRAGTVSFEAKPTGPVNLENLLPMRLPPPDSAPVQGDPRVTPCWRVVPDHVDTTPSEFTHYKTTRRDMYDSARQRAAIALTDEKEVLLVHDGFIIECSITTPYFWRDGRWVTPPVPAKFSSDEGCGGQDGTTRRWALERGIVAEQAVKAESLVDGEQCWISNGVRGFIAAIVRLR